MRWSRNPVFPAVLVVTLTANLTYAVDDAAIEAALATYDKLLHDSNEAGERPGPAEEGKFIDQALEKFKLQELTADQLLRIVEGLPVRNSRKTGPALDALLAKRAAAENREGAEAAIVRLSLMPFDAKPERRAASLKEVLSHPAIKGAIAAGLGGPVFETAGGLPATQLIEARAQLLGLAGSVNAESSTTFFIQAAGFFLAAGKRIDDEELRKFAPLRESLVTALRDKLKGPTGSGPRKEELEKSLATLDGAFAKGEFIGHPAPEIEFLWFSDPADPGRKVKSLSELKGKVVVLDFWATWCGACVAAFPKVKAVSRYYRDYDVVVIGVTSSQARRNGGAGSADPAAVLQKEFDQMVEFIKAKEVTWPIVFSKPTTTPEYGVTAIPHVVIIDTKGNVRYAGVDLDTPLSEKTKLIDGLLAEAGKPFPATLMIRKPRPATKD